jgi:hypothetical protein
MHFAFPRGLLGVWPMDKSEVHANNIRRAAYFMFTPIKL